MGYAKVIHKKRRKKRKKKEKNDTKVSEYLKQWILRCPPEKKDE